MQPQNRTQRLRRAPKENVKKGSGHPLLEKTHSSPASHFDHRSSLCTAPWAPMSELI